VSSRPKHKPVVGNVQPSHLFGQRTHLGVARHERPAVLDVDVGAQRLGVRPFDPRAFGVQPGVEPAT
jgi:hypothetical protein